eukprot:jgi/Tetstr1/446547/TSEL_034072.t1
MAMACRHTLFAFMTVALLVAVAHAKRPESRLIVKWKQGVNPAGKEVPGLQGKPVRKGLSKRLGLDLVELEPGTDAESALQELLQSGLVEQAEIDAEVSIDLTPNDPSFGSLWGMTKIDADLAWDETVGSESVVVCVVDTDFDDDGNGYVDDVYGWDAYNNNGDPNDEHSHGTHCAGTVGARGNNGKGVAGVSHIVKIMACKFLGGANGSGSTSGAIKCIDYCAANGAQIGSHSWGGGGYSSALKNAIETTDMIHIAAAGNDGRDTDAAAHYPSSYDSPNLISVASTTSSDTRSSFSNWGLTSVDLGAPGSSILSTVLGTSYGRKSGTSMATPHVSGAAALLLAKNPTLSYAVVKDLLMTTGDTINDLVDKTVSGKRLNVANALAATPSRNVPWALDI